MQKRKLGSSGIEIAPLMLGGNVLGWTADQETSFSLLDRFVAADLNAIDTADTYSTWVPGHKGGESETIIGNWLKARGAREKVVIATKVGWDQKQGGLARDRIMGKAEASLRRLQTDYIDLYQSHLDDTTTPLEETLAAHQRLIEQGKVRAIGC
jgi:aryl-alcohol dehydrogenase-like predicted oxidoreductase